ncbi:7-deoxyloganetin glucosyltransferase-like [Andrographis paniculata]|uniref:Glycosyltransferase n=1 Tax=Andrographis paniculata TaxID=175694 RepID=A0A3S7QI84_ANDPA|nr:7-deoxyloganetin glucosyltransferase-like [Andrographis paniculata]AXL95247.1 UDP-glycosyltransferase [Andrographis paniculata]QZJ84684.1 UDP-glycosyltransferase 13 [Andrographis paniculata]
MARPEAKGHAVLVPFPAQGHITPMLNLGKLLHQSGRFFITFVNTHYNHRRFLRSGGPSALHGLPDFRFASIPDGLPPSDADATQDVPALCASTSTNCLEPFCDLISELNSDGGPPVSCIVGDGGMTFTLTAAERFGVAGALLWTSSAPSVLANAHYRSLVEKGYIPLKDASQLSNGYLDTIIDWVPGMPKDIRLRDFSSFIRTTDPNDIVLNFIIREIDAAPKAKALILNTFDALDSDILNSLSAIFLAPVYAVGPLNLMKITTSSRHLDGINSSLWKEDFSCIEWLDQKEPQSVVYVNFGSITVMTIEQLTEFAWGLANSNKPFLWVIRPDVVVGEKAMLPPEFLIETEERSMIVSWCPQDQVLKHPAIGGFLTHCGWNSTLESIVSGVPMLCWPFFADQQTNCRYACVEWGVGLEINNDVKRDEVESLIKELMGGEKGRKMKENAMAWKGKVAEAIAPGGTSYSNFNKLINVLSN